MTDTMQKIASKLYDGEDEEVAGLVQEALDQGMDPGEILASGLIAGMDEVGKDFKAGDLFVPEVLIAARAMHAGMDMLKPLLAESGVTPRGSVLIGTVKGDLHDIGKNLVAMMLEGGGYEVIDLEVDVAPEAFVEAIDEHNPDIVALSALLTTTMPSMKDTIEALTSAGARDKVKVIIGGAPVTQAYADEIGADGYAPDAASAVDLVAGLVA